MQSRVIRICALGILLSTATVNAQPVPPPAPAPAPTPAPAPPPNPEKGTTGESLQEGITKQFKPRWNE